jgi:dTDP-glucose pyrophosphorylase
MIKEAFILSGGLGTRIYPLGQFIPKCLIPVFDLPLIIYQINMLETLGVNRIFLVVNQKFETMVKQALEIGYHGQVSIHFIIQKNSSGCGEATTLGSHLIHNKFFLILGDEYYESDYFFRTTIDNDHYDHFLGITHYDSLSEITSGCHLIVKEDYIERLYEKPKFHEITGRACWNGAVVTTSRIFEELDQLKSEGKVDPKRGVILVEALQRLIAKGIKIGAIVDPGININITTINDYLRAAEIEKMKRLKQA